MCFWEDEPDQAGRSSDGGANQVSLEQARANYARFGACDPEHVDDVRAPTPGEMPRVPLWAWGTVISAPPDEPADEVRVELAGGGYLILTREDGHEFDVWVEGFDEVLRFLTTLEVTWR